MSPRSYATKATVIFDLDIYIDIYIENVYIIKEVEKTEVMGLLVKIQRLIWWVLRWNLCNGGDNF